MRYNNNKKVYCFFSFSFFLAFFASPVANNNMENQGSRNPPNQFLPANLYVNLEEMDSFRPKSCYLRITSSLFMNVMH